MERISDLATRLEIQGIDTRSAEFRPISNNWEYPTCFWDCVVQNGGTFTPGVDWGPQFDPTSAITDRVEFRDSTSGGELRISNPSGGAAIDDRRCRIQVYALQPQTIRYAYSFDGALSTLQIAVNGVRTEISGPAAGYSTLSLLEGYNNIQIVARQVDDVHFMARLFDGITVFWVDPRAPRNPSRPEFASDGSGGFGSTQYGTVATISSSGE